MEPSNPTRPNVVTGENVATFLGLPDTADLERVAFFVLIAEQMVRGYTRGQGFDLGMREGIIAPDLRAIVISVAARMMTNPQLSHRIEVGGF